LLDVVCAVPSLDAFLMCSAVLCNIYAAAVENSVTWICIKYYWAMLFFMPEKWRQYCLQPESNTQNSDRDVSSCLMYHFASFSPECTVPVQLVCASLARFLLDSWSRFSLLVAQATVSEHWKERAKIIFRCNIYILHLCYVVSVRLWRKCIGAL